MPKLPKKGREAQYHPHVGQKRHERFYDDQTCHKKPTVDFVSPPTTDHDTQSNKNNQGNINYFKSAGLGFRVYLCGIR